MTEKNLTKKVLEYLRTLPESHWVKILGGPYQTTGISDILGCYKGHFVAIELKVGHNRPTARQALFMSLVRLAGGQARVCWSLDEVKAFIDEINDETN